MWAGEPKKTLISSVNKMPTYLQRATDLEMQRILYEEAKSGQSGLSMYERVKRKRKCMATAQSEEAKKTQALERLREKSEKKVRFIFVLLLSTVYAFLQFGLRL